MWQWVPFLSTGLAFASLITGGVIGTFSLSFFPQKVYQLFALCGGILLALLFELITNAIEQFSDFGVGLGMGAIIGLGLMFLLENLLHNKKKNAKELTVQSSLILTIAVGLHNFPSGIALGGTFLKGNNDLTFLMLAVFFFHILPEGVALVIPFLLSGKALVKFSGPALVLALILGGGTFIGLFIGNDSQKLNSLLMGMALSSISYVAIFEIILKAIKNLRINQFIISFLLGFMLVAFYLNVI